jgi:hypothetical protein
LLAAEEPSSFARRHSRGGCPYMSISGSALL